jgi:transmembrane sensor
MNLKLAFKYMTDSASPEKRKAFEKWLAESEKNHMKYKQFVSAWLQKEEDIKQYNPDTQASWEQFAAKHNIHAGQVSVQRRGLFVSHWRSIAAAILLIVTGFFIFYTTGVLKGKETFSVYIAHDSVLFIPLDDGSKVWLNKNAELKVSQWKKDHERKVFLKGEAFFKVATDTLKPFIVETNHTTTRVLGTSFNISNSAHKDIVTLMSGTIELSTGQGKNDALILKSGERVSYNAQTKLMEKSVFDNNNFMAWKTGNIEFADTPLPEVLEIVTNYYNLTNSVDNDGLEEYFLTASFHKQPLEKVISVLELTWDIQFSIENDTLYRIHQ